MKLFGLKTQDGISPGVTTIRVLNKLDLIDNCNIIGVLEVCHLDGAGKMCCIMLKLFLLTSYKVTCYSKVRHGF